jgi:recombination protein RecR
VFLPEALQSLIIELQKLPGVGEKTALRFAFNLQQRGEEAMMALVKALRDVAEKVRPCPRCGFFAEGELCKFCSSPDRDRQILSVVETPADVIAIERAMDFKGLYHVLGGVISALRRTGPENLRVKELVERVKNEGVKEVIIVTSASAEGETTALYIKKALEGLDVKVTRPATGIPMGSSIEFLDALTLSRALRARKEL